MRFTNKKIRIALIEAEVVQYEVAEELGISDQSFSRMLRYELPPDKQKKILDVIDELKKEGR